MKRIFLAVLVCMIARCSHQMSQYSYNHMYDVIGEELKDMELYSYSNQWFSELISCKPQAKNASKFRECVDTAFDRGRNRINQMYSLADKAIVEDKYVSERNEGIKKASQDFRSWSKFESHTPLNEDEMVATIASLYFYEQLVRKSYQENKATILYALHTEAMTRYQDALHQKPHQPQTTPAAGRQISSESKVRRLETLKEEDAKKN